MIKKSFHLFLIVSIALIVSGCASKFTRYGYTLKDIPNSDKYFGCTIPIKKDFQYNKEDAEVLGEILAGDSGFSLDCNQGHVLNIFRQEACALQADLINIVYERDIDLWSSCYRAKAEFLRFKNREKLKNLESDPEYK